MADKLAKVRTKFVESVSKEVINQLLDSLLEDGVLNEGEKESILEENRTRADKARGLIDSVKKKGDRASNTMITHLQTRDQSLFSSLGLSGCPPAQTSLEPKEEIKWATSLITTTDGFYQKKTQDNCVYSSSKDSIRNRVALLITNIHFANLDQNRTGAERDQENMVKLLTELRYDIVRYQDLTAKDMDNALSNFSTHPKLAKTDSVFVVIMSHGKLGVILGINGENDEFPIDRIYEHLGSERCPALVNKPKVIIVQACRGAQLGATVVPHEAQSDTVSHVSQEDVIEEDKWKYIHKEKDFIALLSSTPHTVSYRHKSAGSFLIQFIVEVFNTFAHEEHIEELFRQVMHRFEDFDLSNRRQMPTKDRCTLTKHLYLFPGH